MYYARQPEGAPREWMARVKQCLRSISPQFNAQRMIHEYMQLLYLPAHDGWLTTSAKHFEAAREKATWERGVEQVWDRVRIGQAGWDLPDTVISGQPILVRSTVDLAGLKPEDVKVEAVVGRVGVSGHLEDTEVVQLKPEGLEGASIIFARGFVPQHTGRLGFAIRVSPNHFEDPLNRPCNPLMKWS